MNYLKNDICSLTLLNGVNFSLNKKVNILSTSFFKMNNHYKNFNIYMISFFLLFTVVLYFITSTSHTFTCRRNVCQKARWKLKYALMVRFRDETTQHKNATQHISFDVL